MHANNLLQSNHAVTVQHPFWIEVSATPTKRTNRAAPDGRSAHGQQKPRGYQNPVSIVLTADNARLAPQQHPLLGLGQLATGPWQGRPPKMQSCWQLDVLLL